MYFNNFISTILMILSSSLIAFSSLARKYLSNIDGIYLTMFICFVGSSLLMWWIVSISSLFRIIPHDWKSIFIRVIFSLLAQVFLFISLDRNSLFVTMLLFNTSPIFIPFIRFVLFRKKINNFSLVCILISFIGIYLVLRGNADRGVNIFALCSLLSGMFNGVSQVILHKASQKEDLFVMNLWIYTFMSLVMFIFIPFNIASIKRVELLLYTPLTIWICVAIILLTISSQIFRVKAFKYTSDPSIVAPGMYFSVIVAVILDMFFYKMYISYVEVCGILIVCVISILSLIRKS